MMWKLFLFLVFVILSCSSNSPNIKTTFATGVSAAASFVVVPSSTNEKILQRQQHRSYSIATTQQKKLLVRGGGRFGNKATSKDDDETSEEAVQQRIAAYASETASLFANVRIPAALFAGASAGAAFAMPLSPATDTLKVALVKRVYALLMILALSNQLITIVASTLSLEAISEKRHNINSTQQQEQQEQQQPVSSSLTEFVTNNYEFEWITTKVHFFSGILAFLLAAGIRAWIFISCPVVAQGALLIILSASATALSFLEESNKEQFDNFLFGRICIKYWKLLWQKSRKNMWFGISMTLTLITYGYILAKIPHVYNYLAAAKK